MPQIPPNYQHAARTVAQRVEKLVLEMLIDKQVGEVAVVVSWGQLEPEKRVVDKDRVVKVGRGRMDTLTRVE